MLDVEEQNIKAFVNKIDKSINYIQVDYEYKNDYDKWVIKGNYSNVYCEIKVEYQAIANKDYFNFVVDELICLISNQLFRKEMKGSDE